MPARARETVAAKLGDRAKPLASAAARYARDPDRFDRENPYGSDELWGDLYYVDDHDQKEKERREIFARHLVYLRYTNEMEEKRAREALQSNP